MIIHLDFTKVLALLSAGKKIADACAEGGVPYPILNELRKIDQAFEEAYQAAYKAGENLRPKRGRH